MKLKNKMAQSRNCLLCAVLSLFLLTFQVASAAQKVIHSTKFQGVAYLYMADVASFYGMSCKLKGKKVNFISKYSNFAFEVDSRVMTLNGTQIHLSRPIVDNKGSRLISKSDFENLLEPILRPKFILPKKQIVNVLIDPGHGGKDVGAVANKDYEKDINLQVALRLAKKLQAKGFKIFMTRARDSDLTLEQRTNFAKKIKADLYISIHCNSAGKDVTGLETYIATPEGDPNVGDTKATKGKCSANAYNRENAYLAFQTQQTILKKTKMEDRGVRRKRFYVIRNTTCPSMLVEIGFISNDKERANLKLATWQEKIAEAITETAVKFRETSKPQQ